MSVFEDLEKQFPSQTHKLSTFRATYELLKDKPGDFAEFGCYNGNGARELASLDPNRLVWAFDTYQGMPIEDYGGQEDASDPPGKWMPSGKPEDLFKGIPNIHPVEGRFENTLWIASDRKFLLVHVDCDYYKSHKQVLEFLAPRLVHGATIFFDDYGLQGAKRAVNEWMEIHKDHASFDGHFVIVWNG